MEYRSWMYPFARSIGKLKRAIKHKSKQEGSMCEVDLAKETSHFCSYYFRNDVARLRNKPNRHYDTNRWVGSRAEQPFNAFQEHIEEFRATQSTGTPMTPEIVEQQWMN
ncbi:hypothetical protein K7X08_022206 [Anisodus acutangulus]|uniref:DUF4218 domain-containing protein n=1 Tax=Anisodus acutangulus TaxID=402998 RepID=A0A9Q1L6V6_9SOLA|nr:hypothetical protein K7X08_022206 [Anisodus acutangulus]